MIIIDKMGMHWCTFVSLDPLFGILELAKNLLRSTYQQIRMFFFLLFRFNLAATIVKDNRKILKNFWQKSHSETNWPLNEHSIISLSYRPFFLVWRSFWVSLNSSFATFFHIGRGFLEAVKNEPWIAIRKLAMLSLMYLGDHSYIT